MHSFKSAIPQAISTGSSDLFCHSQSPFYFRGEEGGRNVSRFTDIVELEQSIGNEFNHNHDVVNLSTSSIYSEIASKVLQFGGLTNNVGSTEIVSSGTVAVVDGQGGGPGGNCELEKWGDSGVVADHSQRTDTSTDSTDDKIQAYVQQLENSRQQLAQLEQELKRARQKEVPKMRSREQTSHSVGGNGASSFDQDYARWLDEHQGLMDDLRSAVNSHASDTELRILVDGVMSHYVEIFRIKSICTKSDVFHILTGMWKTPVERCFMWLGGFRSSDFLKILRNQIEPLTEQQLMGIFNLEQSSQQAEDALSQGMEALQQSFVETLSSNSRNPGTVVDYMGQMAIAMSKLATLENFLNQADLLRQQTLQQLQRILTTHQAARALLAISDYESRLRALSSLWLARPKE